MKKDIKWLKAEVEKQDIVMDKGYIYTSDLIYLIDSLGEPEVLSQEWIDEHAKEVAYDGIPDQAEVVYVDDLENLIIPKQELPVIPEFVADYIQEGKELGCDLGTAMTVQTEMLKGIRDYIKNNEENFARAWLDGHTIASEEEEPLYRVSAADMRSGFWFLCKDNDGDIMIGTNKDYYRVGWDSLKLTEQEIKDYDPRYMAFAIPVEEDE